MSFTNQMEGTMSLLRSTCICGIVMCFIHYAKIIQSLPWHYWNMFFIRLVFIWRPCNARYWQKMGQKSNVIIACLLLWFHFVHESCIIREPKSYIENVKWLIWCKISLLYVINNSEAILLCLYSGPFIFFSFTRLAFTSWSLLCRSLLTNGPLFSYKQWNSHVGLC